MNKQEVIEKIEGGLMYEVTRHIGKAVNVYDAIDIVKQIDGPEKPVVPRFVADWYEDNKDEFEFNLYRLCVDYDNCELDKEMMIWFRDKNNNPIQTLTAMHQLGYEVKKEKLYTVKFVTEDFGKIYIGLFKNFKKLGITSLVSNDDELRTHFNEEELKRFKFWDNPAFEVREVKE